MNHRKDARRPSIGRDRFSRPSSSPSRHDDQWSTKKSSTQRPISKPVDQGGLGSTKIMRKAGFSGKLHRGHVVDGATNSGKSCLIKELCGSCKFVNTNYGESLREKFQQGVSVLKASGTLESARILDPVPSPTPLNYRSYFKLAVRPASKAQQLEVARLGETRRFAVGLFQPGTHQVAVNLSTCPIHSKPLTFLLKDLEKELEASPLTPWDETTDSGELRYIAARSAHLTGEIMLTFVVRHPKKQELLRLVNRMRRMGHKINCAFMNVNVERGNAIFGQETVHLMGTSGLRERVCDLDIEISPLAFFQVNPWQANQLYRRVETHAGQSRSNAVAWDLYTGTGQIALMLGRLGYKALGVEEIEAATQDAQKNGERNQLTGRVSFLASRVEDMEQKIPTWAEAPAVIVVNPSRRGIHEKALSHLTHLLTRSESSKLIYVSCEAETLARDLKTLTRSGHKVRQVEAFDMFAQTEKLEWIAVLTK